MEELLSELLSDLSVIAKDHGEVNDSDVEEAMSRTIFDGYFKPAADFSLPETFHMYSGEGDTLVRTALMRFIDRARPLAESSGMGFQKRLASFQNLSVTVGDAEESYNDFFRYFSPDNYDDFGNPK